MGTLFARLMKQKVRRHYPRPRGVSITLLWARNPTNIGDTLGDGGSEVYLTKRVVFVVFLVLRFIPPWSRVNAQEG